LLTKPTLVWKLDVNKPGKHDTRIAYITRGMRWNADYILSLRENDTVDLSAWVTVHNNSGVPYKNAKLKLVAGDLHLAEERVREIPHGFSLSPAVADGAQGFQEKSFFEYHLYTLPRPTTLKENQVKQIELFTPVAGVQAKRLYEYHGQYDGSKVRLLMAFKNEKANKLGMPLPKGRIRLMARDTDGEEHHVGAGSIDHTPAGEEVKVQIGNAFDVVGERVVTDRKKGIYTIVIKLRNHSDKDLTVKVLEHLKKGVEPLKSSREFKRQDAMTIEFLVDLKKGTEETITYTTNTR
jgi:hypothetical protein